MAGEDLEVRMELRKLILRSTNSRHRTDVLMRALSEMRHETMWEFTRMMQKWCACR